MCCQENEGAERDLQNKFAIGRPVAEQRSCHKNDKVKPLKPNSNILRKDRNGCVAIGHVFLGHKLLGELRILMRLSSDRKREPSEEFNPGSVETAEPAY